MVITWTVYFEDGTNGSVSCEKPPGAHPLSIASVVPAIYEAERTGKTVLRIGRTVVIGGLPIDRDVATREDVFGQAKRMAPHLIAAEADGRTPLERLVAPKFS